MISLIRGINGSFQPDQVCRFAGSRVNSSSAAVLQLGLRYNPINNVYPIGRVNGLVKDFIGNSASLSGLSGYALTFAYRTPSGPGVKRHVRDQSRRLQSYVLFGITFLTNRCYLSPHETIHHACNTSCKGVMPVLGADCYIAPNATIVGDGGHGRPVQCMVQRGGTGRREYYPDGPESERTGWRHHPLHLPENRNTYRK